MQYMLLEIEEIGFIYLFSTITAIKLEKPIRSDNPSTAFCFNYIILHIFNWGSYLVLAECMQVTKSIVGLI